MSAIKKTAQVEPDYFKGYNSVATCSNQTFFNTKMMARVRLVQNISILSGESLT